MTGQAKKKTSDDYSGLDVAKGPSSKAALPKNEEELVDRMASICQQTLEELQPVLAQITQVCLRSFIFFMKSPYHILI
jgi:hypothetical protein